MVFTNCFYRILIGFRSDGQKHERSILVGSGILLDRYTIRSFSKSVHILYKFVVCDVPLTHLMSDHLFWSRDGGIVGDSCRQIVIQCNLRKSQQVSGDENECEKESLRQNEVRS